MTENTVEAYRALRTNLQFLDFEAETRAFVVTSSISAEGKSTTAVNLALAIADAGRSVVIVDADLRRPKVANYLGVDGSVGLVDVLVGTSSLDDALQDWGEHGLAVLPCGPVPPNPSELLQSATMGELIATLRTRFDTVLFDAPPLLPVSDAAILSRQTSGALVVAAAKRVKKPQLRAALNNIDQVGARTLGIVITMVPVRGGDSYGYGYTAYGYQSPSASRE
jgi:succinoglycan biosynthesis transport protein ExoP